MLSEKHLEFIIFQPWYPESLNLMFFRRPKVMYLRSCPGRWKVQTWFRDHLSCLISFCTGCKMNCHCGKARGLRPAAGMQCSQIQPTTIGEWCSLSTHYSLLQSLGHQYIFFVSFNIQLWFSTKQKFHVINNQQSSWKEKKIGNIDLSVLQVL